MSPGRNRDVVRRKSNSDVRPSRRTQRSRLQQLDGAPGLATQPFTADGIWIHQAAGTYSSRLKSSQRRVRICCGRLWRATPRRHCNSATRLRGQTASRILSMRIKDISEIRQRWPGVVEFWTALRLPSGRLQSVNVAVRTSESVNCTDETKASKEAALRDGKANGGHKAAACKCEGTL